ncbi:putative ribonuclease H-like domain-containing protein [Tanacetum coccineum]
MDVKSVFLYGTIEEEVYVHQPPGFVDPAHPNKVYKVVKALYGLYQAHRAWYETLSSFLLENGFRRDVMHKRFQMSSMGELTFFLGLQVKQQPDGIFISQDKCGYCKNLKKTVKTGQTRTRERKRTQRAGRMLSKVNNGQHKSTFSQTWSTQNVKNPINTKPVPQN